MSAAGESASPKHQPRRFYAERSPSILSLIELVVTDSNATRQFPSADRYQDHADPDNYKGVPPDQG